MKTTEIKKVFLVEDDKLVSLNLKLQIETNFDHKIEVFCFAVGELCIDEIAKEKPLCVILDAKLNSRYYDAMTGGQVLKEILNKDKKIPVIMHTATTKVDEALSYIYNGAYDFHVKANNSYLNICKSINAILNGVNKSQHNFLRELPEFF